MIMKNKTKLTLVFAYLLCLSFKFDAHAQKYKDMMADYTVNFYDVVKEAEVYFKTIDYKAKGSGYKNFMRWVNNNEHMYYPSGNRMIIDPAFSSKAFNTFKKSNKTNTKKSEITSSWRELGPFLIENITQHYSAGMGRVEDFYVDPDNDQKIYIGSRSGGFWKTFDGGLTWNKSGTESLPASGVNTIAVKPSNTDHVFIGLRNSSNGYSYGIYESVDAGNTFNETRFNPSNLGLGGLGSNFRIYTVAHHPRIPNLLLVGTSQGLYKTTNDFMNWTHVIASGDFFQVKFHPTNNNVIYTVNYAFEDRDLVYMSNNTGNSFSTHPILDNYYARGRIDVTKDEPDAIFFASNSGVWKSDDRGITFTAISTPVFGADGFAVNDLNGNNLLIGSIDMANSTDGGLNFTQRTSWYLANIINGIGSFEDNYFNSTAYVHADLRVAKSVNGVFYVGTDGFLAKSIDGGVNWENLMQVSAPAIRENYKLGTSQSDNRVTVCGSQDNGTTVKHAEEWVEVFGADGMEGIILPLNPNYMISSYQFGGRIRSLNGGVSNSIIVSNDTDGDWEAPLIYDPNNHFKIYDFRNGIYVSDDFGLNYDYVGTPDFLANAIPVGDYWSQIRNAEIAQNNSDIMVVNNRRSIEKSIDGGRTFTNIKGTLPDHIIMDMAFNPKNDDDFIIVNASYQNNNEKVYRTTDGGTTWVNISYNLNDIPVHTVVIDHTANPNIYIGTEVGVYYKPLEGNTWTLYNTGLPNVTVEELEINYGANTLKAATWGRGLWEYDLVGRANYPSIEQTTITHTPTLINPKVGKSQFVTSNIIYEGVLSEVEVKYSVDNLLFNNTITMSNIGGNTWASDFALPDALVGEKVYFKVVATGSSSDTSETYKFMYEVRDFIYCDSSGLDGTGSDYIEQVSIGSSFVNNSRKTNYTLFDELDPVILNVGETYELTSSLEFAFPLDKAAAWIDFNNNAEFEASEEITMSPYISNTSTGSFTVPEDAVLNQISRLRITSAYDTTVIDPCGTFFAGEVEDYLIIIDNPLSVEDFNILNKTIDLYPNPSNGDVFIKSKNNFTKVELYDIRGKKVIQQNNLEIKEITFNIGHLQEAVYILMIHTLERKIVKKVVKIN